MDGKDLKSKAIEKVKEKKGIIGEFKQFIAKGNVMDLAVPSLPLAKNFFKSQAKNFRNLLDFFLDLWYNYFVVIYLYKRGLVCLLMYLKIMEQNI